MERFTGVTTYLPPTMIRPPLRGVNFENIAICAGLNTCTWLQQDGATAHTSYTAMPVIRQLFPNKVISRRGDIPWSPRTPDLSPMDFILWGYLKTKIYEKNPQSIVELKENIRREMLSITELICLAVWKILVTVYKHAKNEMEHIWKK
ncbi:hypothetical protein EVAR_7055_1 [Eumeta japonica]|uniref:Transposable element Tc3 transposase n=1 Tax=Eumeta variegata TaxID=151549 RepID=A0A4C1XAU6_EUMVA|nr:hypothetical protein EVAR_7055_1 [Eumeta japonica]